MNKRKSNSVEIFTSWFLGYKNINSFDYSNTDLVLVHWPLPNTQQIKKNQEMRHDKKRKEMDLTFKWLVL